MPKFEVYEPTMLQAYTYCPEKFYLRYVDGLEQGASLALFKGLVGHHVLANPDEPLDELFIAAATNYRSGVLTPKFDLPQDEEMKAYEELATEIVNWRRYAGQHGIEILEREKQIEFDIAGRKIRGTIDIIYRTPLTKPGYVLIGDFKFGRKQSPGQMNRNIQHGLYYYGLRLAGYDVQHNSWIQMQDLIPYKKDGKTARKGSYRGQVIYPIEITDTDLPFIASQALQVIGAIEAGVRFQRSYGIDGPCGICEYAYAGCEQFAVGRAMQHNNDLAQLNQAAKEAAMIRELEG
jgi:hypothetical protein